MADFNTPNLDYIEPEDGGSVNTWGVKLNSNFRKLDLDVNARILRSGDVFTGRVGFVAGTESLPSMFFAGDPDTGFFQEGANSISISTAGVKRISIGNTLISIATALMINGNLAYAGTLTGGTGVINIASGQIFKDAFGNVGLGTLIPLVKLDVSGEIRAGSQTATSGSTILSGFYTLGDVINTFGSQRSSGGTNIGFSAEPRTDAQGWRSTQAQFASSPKVLEMDSDGFRFLSGPLALTPRNNPLTLAVLASITSTGNILLGGLADDGSRFRSFGVLNQTLGNFRQADNGQELRIISRADGITLNAANGTQNTIFSRGALLESARITDAGFGKFSNTGDYSGNGLSVAGGYHHFQGNTPGSTALIASHINIGNGSVFEAYADSAATGLLFQGIAAGSVTFRVRTNGNVETLNNSYGALSDAKLKKVVGPVTSYWEKYKLIEWIKYTLKDDPTDQVMLGVIAQQVEGIFPGLIQSTPDMVDVPKSRPVIKTVPVTKTETQQIEKVEIVLVDGKYVRKVTKEPTEVQVPVIDEFPVYDENGAIVMQLVTPAVEPKDAVLDEEGNVVEAAVEAQDAVYAPLMHKVSRTETSTESETYTEKEPNGEVTLSVKYSILGHIADVVLQEAMARIEVNEAEIEDLKARIYALESKA